MTRLSRAALETLNGLIDQMGAEMAAMNVETFMATKARIAMPPFQPSIQR